MRPILFHVFGTPVSSFGVMVAAGMLAGLFWTRLEARRAGLAPEFFLELFGRVMLAGILGARLLYCAIHPEEFREAGWLAPIAFWRGGLVFYGGLLAAVATGVFVVVRRRQPLRRCGDVAAPGVWLGLAIGRIGCFLVADDWGRPTGSWLGVRFPEVEGSRLDPALFHVPLHPTQLYDSLNGLLAFAVAAVALRRSRRAGVAAGLSLCSYSAGRFAVESVRGDDAARVLFGPLATSQWISLAVFAAGLAVATRFSASGPASASGAGG
jgi:phosphatidylglycerol:prolipoprotein diacylglycerol transferase